VRALLVLGVALAAGPFGDAVVRADTPPTVWDLARDPAERERWELHVRVERLLHPPLAEEQLPLEYRRDEELRFEAARALLEAAGAEHSPDVRLRFDLGIVYWRLAEATQQWGPLARRVVDVLVPALSLAPDATGATGALEALVYAYARLERPRDELSAWRQYIPRLLDDRTRVVAMMNMGEAEMRLGLIDDAVGTFRQVLHLCGELPNTNGVSSTYVLTLWDLAVALDRSGDSPGAIDTAAKASRVNVIGSSGLPTSGRALIAGDPDVFYVPEWEREWYLALSAAAAARDAGDVRTAAALRVEAEGHWDTYVTRSAGAGGHDPWLPIARVRRDRAHVERVAAEKRAAKLPALAPPPDKSWTTN
jgi:tetratricopeptide (TPR) repeat protein